VVESEEIIGLVLTSVEGGELFDYISKKQHLKEPEAFRLFLQLMQGSLRLIL
jgi:hypothetical protein